MALEIAFELEEEDLEHFREIMRVARDKVKDLSGHEIIQAARQMIENLQHTKHPRFVQLRLDGMESIFTMSQDEEWRLPDESNARVLNALAYFCEPHDLIPDDTPGIGLLDDAIMMELVIRELKPELDSYKDFHEFRQREDLERKQAGTDTPVTRAEWLDAKRKELQKRVSKRRKDRDSGGFFSIFPFL